MNKNRAGCQTAPCFLLHLKFFILLLVGHHGCFSSPVPRFLGFFFSLPLPAGHHGFFSSPVPRFLGFFFSLPLLAGHHGCFSSPVPRPSVFSSLFPSRRGITAAFLLLCPAPWIFLLSLPNNQNPVTSLDLISGHTIGLPKGCHRHIIPLSNIPQAVTLTYYINSQ